MLLICAQTVTSLCLHKSPRRQVALSGFRLRAVSKYADGKLSKEKAEVKDSERNKSAACGLEFSSFMTRQRHREFGREIPQRLDLILSNNGLGLLISALILCVGKIS